MVQKMHESDNRCITTIQQLKIDVVVMVSSNMNLKNVLHCFV